MRFLTLLMLLIACTQTALACQELIWSPEEYAQNSNRVYIGLVESISLLKTDKLIDIRTYKYSKRIAGDIDVTLKVLKSLKGDVMGELKIPLNWCRGGQYELGDLVVAYKFGEYWHVKNTKSAIDKTTKALTRPSN